MAEQIEPMEEPNVKVLPPARGRRHSGFGMTSFALLGPTVFVGIVILVFAVRDEGWTSLIVLVNGVPILMLLSLIGVCFAIAGLCQKNRMQHTSLTGVIVHGGILVTLVGFAIAAVWVRRESPY